MNSNKLAYIIIALMVGTTTFRYIESRKKLKETERLTEMVNRSLDDFQKRTAQIYEERNS